MAENENETIVKEPETQAETQKDVEPAKKSAGKVDKYGKDILPIAELHHSEEEYSEKEYEELRGLYEETLSEIQEGETVVGRILEITAKEVKVDIGFKSEGVIPADEFTNLAELSEGDEVDVFLENVEDKDGQLVLSRKKADFMKLWEKIIHVYESGETIEGTIVRRIKGGMVVNVQGVDAFLPGSQIDVKPIRDFDAYVGKSREFKIVKLNDARKNIVVSSRAIIEESLFEHRQEILDGLEKGQILEGSVKNITDFGVFIDLGGVDGLLHITDLSWGRVNHPSEIMSLDEKANVMVLDFNEAKDRISLGLKQLHAQPWENAADKYPIGTKVIGRVVSITDYGAFVEIEKGIEGLIHISEMSWTQHIKHPSKILSIGDEVEATVLNIQPEERKVSLGMKQNQPDPWDGVEAKFPVGSRHTGRVRNLTNFGAFVELEPGVDGLIHISDLSWTKKVRHPGEIVKKAEEIEVMILSIDRDSRRISLSHKHINENPWDGFAEVYNVDSISEGRVVRTIEKGVIVELPLGVEGFVPGVHLLKKEGKEPYAEGDTMKLKIIEFDKDNKKIVLSESDAATAEERKEVEDYLKSQNQKAAETPSETASEEKVKTPEVKDQPAADETSDAPTDTAGEETAVEKEVETPEVKDQPAADETSDAPTDAADEETAVEKEVETPEVNDQPAVDGTSDAPIDAADEETDEDDKTTA